MRWIARLLTLVVSLSWFTACTSVPQPSAPTPGHPRASSAARTSPRTARSTTIADIGGALHMTMARAAHTATLLANGQVLVTGGFTGSEQATASAEVFDPTTRSFSSTAPMYDARQSHTAILLPTGKVLIAGGLDTDYLASAELYDPTTGTFSATGSMTTARSGHVAVLLDTGNVLIAGGVGRGWTFLASAELYDPQTGTFTATGSMLLPRESHTATRLKNGQVLVAGGHQGRRAAITLYAQAELYDPTSGTWTTTGNMTVKRHKHDAIVLTDGRVFITGGADERDEQGVYSTTEIYEPAHGTFTTAANMRTPRYKHTGTSVVVGDSNVLLIGGAATTEIYDPATNTFTDGASRVGTMRLFATATVLRNDDVLFVGGYGPNITADSQAWVVPP